jgi:hypothetical protein
MFQSFTLASRGGTPMKFGDTDERKMPEEGSEEFRKSLASQPEGQARRRVSLRVSVARSSWRFNSWLKTGLPA